MHQRSSSVARVSSSLSDHFAPVRISILLVAILGAGCEKQPLPVGALLPLSGDDAAVGQSTRQGMELAQEELQKEGRATGFVLQFEDTESKADVARQRYEDLLNSRAVMTVGGITPEEAQVLAPRAEERERVVLSPSAHDQQLAANHRFFYRLAPSAAVTGTTIATFASKDLTLDSMVVVAESKIQGDLFEEGLGSTFDRHGGEVLGRFDLDEAEVSWALEEIGRMRPDAIMLAGWGGWLAEMVTTLRDAGYRGKIFAPESFAAAAVREAAGTDARGVLVAASPFETSAEDPETQAFVEAYRSRYGSDPDVFAAAGWDTVLVLDAALTGRPNLPGEVRQWLRDDVKDLEGMIGHLQFNETGAATKYPRIYSVKDDLTLQDHGRWLEEEKQRIAEKRRRLEEQRRRLLEQMSQPDDADPDEEDAGESQSSGQIASSG
ncbi:MAG: ABC transporter substrate-binding protein [Thermoanaerobaculia bacterium]|nr:ABC transporter substrate-binding protein [Thermoanaerobaculia bacterium]